MFLKKEQDLEEGRKSSTKHKWKIVALKLDVLMWKFPTQLWNSRYRMKKKTIAKNQHLNLEKLTNSFVMKRNSCENLTETFTEDWQPKIESHDGKFPLTANAGIAFYFLSTATTRKRFPLPPWKPSWLHNHRTRGKKSDGFVGVDYIDYFFIELRFGRSRESECKVFHDIWFYFNHAVNNY